MSGEATQSVLLANMEPELAALDPIGLFREREGITAILPLPVARRLGLPDPTVLRGIVLNIHSSLETVGLTAAISGRLAAVGISANVVAAFYHDHIFVPARDADRALAALRALRAEAPGRTEP